MGFAGSALRVGLGLSLGLAAVAGPAQATLFNRTRRALVLVPKATAATRPRDRFRIISHDLGNLTRTAQSFGFGGLEPPVVVLPADGLVSIEFRSDGGLAGGLAFEVVTAARPGRAVEVLGALHFVLEGALGTCRTCAAIGLAAPYWVEPAPGNPWALVLRRHNATVEAREQGWAEEVAAADQADKAASASSCLIL